MQTNGYTVTELHVDHIDIEAPLYAHAYKERGEWVLYFSEQPGMDGGGWERGRYKTMRELRRVAKDQGAKPWNF